MIRPEVVTDHAQTEALALAAFAPDERVAELVRKLRVSPALLPELNIVAEVDGEVVGHIMFSRAVMQGEWGQCEVPLLSPLGVLPAYQKQGIGSALVQHAMQWLETSSFGLVVVEGIPDYYPRFGFVSAYDLCIEPPYPVHKFSWLAYPLPAYQTDTKGIVAYPQPFDFLHP